jgi:hypothetical protein
LVEDTGVAGIIKTAILLEERVAKEMAAPEVMAAGIEVDKL